MKILSIAGSPRRRGNSISLLREALEGARIRGHTAKILEARDEVRRR
jgi:multimeric flavodoxin WrbA